MRDTKYSKLILDGHNLYHRAYHANKGLTFRVEKKEIITGGVYGFLRSLNALIRNYLSDSGEIYVLFDNHTSQLEQRRQLDPSYKSQRAELPNTFYRGVDFLQLILLRYRNNMNIVYRHKYEADDLVETVLNNFSRYDRTLLVSQDLDWARSMRENVHWLNKDYIYTPNDFWAEFGFYPTFSSLSLYKTFKGDASDSIKNPLPRFPYDALRTILEQYEDIYGVLKAADDGKLDFINDHWKGKLAEQEIRDHLIRNWELVSFSGPTYDEIEENVFECRFNNRNKGTLKQLYTLLGFTPSKIDNRFIEDNVDPLLGWDTIDRV